MTGSAAPVTAVDTAAAVRAGTRTARATVEAALDRIASRDSDLHAFQVVRREAALREAEAVDARPDRGDLPLAGVPVAVKDNVPVAGEPMRLGSAGSDPAPQPRDHEIVRRLRAAGAVVVGLTTVPELCVFGATDSVYGITRNPWDPERTPGGSSGGSAAAVAAGMVPVAHGNDGLGSIRIPAACCGLVGLKPGLGTVPSELGDGSWFAMAENGALATTVADCALTTAVLAGRPDLAEPGEPERLRIAVSTRSPLAGVRVAGEWAAAVRRAAGLLREAGHTVRPADPPYGQLAGMSEIVRWLAGTELDARRLADRSRLNVPTRRHAAAGRLALRAGFPRESGRARWQRRAAAFFDAHDRWGTRGRQSPMPMVRPASGAHDVLITPTLARAPLPAAAWHERGWLANVAANVRFAPFAAPWNLAGWPAVAVPAGFDADGLPLSVQLVAPPGGEAVLLALAAQLESARAAQPGGCTSR